MNHERTSRFERLLQIRFPDHVAPMVASAAGRHGTQTSQYVRQAVYERLRADGFDPTPIAAHSAGRLYDRLSDGKTRWALVAEGAVVDLSYFAIDPNKAEEQIAMGRTWLPVFHEDSQPFEAAQHFRLTPEARIDGDRVVVTYPVVEKNWETV